MGRGYVGGARPWFWVALGSVAMFGVGVVPSDVLAGVCSWVVVLAWVGFLMAPDRDDHPHL